MNIIPILITSIAFIYIGYLTQVSGKISKQELQGKGSTLLETASSLFTVIGAGEYSFAITLMLSGGLLGTSFLLGLALAFILASEFSTHVRINAFRSKPPRFDGYVNYSTPDFFADNVGNSASLMVSAIGVAAFFGILLVQFVVGGTILAVVCDVHYGVGLAVIVVTITAYCSLAGLRALFHTDVIQGILMWIGLLFVLAYLLVLGPNHAAMQESVTELVRNTPWTAGAGDSLIVLFLTVCAAFAELTFGRGSPRPVRIELLANR